MIEVTDIAIAKLIEKRVDSVRLGVTGGGCSGYEYVFVEDEFKDGDVELDYGKFKFLIMFSPIFNDKAVFPIDGRPAITIKSDFWKPWVNESKS